MPFRARLRAHRLALIGAMLFAASPAHADDAPSSTVPQQEAWWTGPIAASGAETLPSGHVLFEPYLYDARTASSDFIGSVTYLLYGVTDRLTVGVIPTFGAPPPGARGGPRRLQVNDLTLTVQRRLHHAELGDIVPTITLVAQRVLPLGRYDRLGDRPERGIGTGAASNLLGLYLQRADVLPNGHVVRTRLNLVRTFGADLRVRDASVYGTADGFVGRARAGSAFLADASIEYSVTRRVALATDVILRRSASSSVAGRDRTSDAWTEHRIAGSSAFSVAPAVEYSWSARRGVLLGLRYTARGRNTSESVTPVVAFNAVF